ncbi:diacylglycerol kinase family protein [Aurantiacibacter odishensis]|uniref:diacylglycerol kinase family protein n=1 Tax=Aurantiacibacter odishensis TaxID=1155476 RepID=UPI000E73E285|nr:diacylglycerol kinase family protein [Aurantiacibacter odishensis]
MEDDRGQERALWLVHNDASGSNDRETLERMSSSCTDCSLRVAYRSSFPSDDLPTPAMLDAGGIDLVAIFAGDGTVNAALKALAGWGGQVLVLPGGTMNLLYHRLFADLEMEEVLRLAGKGDLRARRPGIIRSALGDAYAGLLAGPGTSWNDVREAMRNTDVLAIATESREAFAHTLQDEPLRCAEPPLGRSEGYPLLLLEPHDERIAVHAYHAETTAEFVDQLLALAKHDFRQGPHDHIGDSDELLLASVGADEFSVLLDGEPAEATGPTQFRLVTCEVDLLAKPGND